MTYETEILTAFEDGLNAFVLKLQRMRVEPVLRRSIQRSLQQDDPLCFAKGKKNRVRYSKLSEVQQRQVEDEIVEGVVDAAVANWHKQRREHIEQVAAQMKVENETKHDPYIAAALGELLDARAEEKIRLLDSVRTYIGPLNRDLNDARIEAYKADMKRGEWWFTPDPIVVTNEGNIINGQHRLIAAEEALPWDGVKPPQFVVVYGVEPRAALLMDEARRTANDRRDIAMRFAAQDGPHADDTSDGVVQTQPNRHNSAWRSRSEAYSVARAENEEVA